MKAILLFLVFLSSVSAFECSHLDQQPLLRLKVSAVGINNVSCLFVDSQDSTINFFHYENSILEEQINDFPPDQLKRTLIAQKDTWNLVDSDVFKIQFNQRRFDSGSQEYYYPLTVQMRTEMGFTRKFRTLSGSINYHQKQRKWIAKVSGVYFDEISTSVNILLNMKKFKLYLNGNFQKSIDPHQLEAISESTFNSN